MSDEPLVKRLPLVSLSSVKERAQNLADGIAVNREKFARDVSDLCAECEHWRNVHAATVAEADVPR